MTVKELIKLLKKADPDAEVIHYWYDDWAVGDGDNYEPADVEIELDRVVFR